jgi:hypothetical protein
MKIGPASIVDLICEEFTLDHKPVKLIQLIEEVVRTHYSDLDSIDKATEWEQQVRSKLQTYIIEADKRGVQPQIAFNSSSSYMIQGACFIEGKDSGRVIEQKKRRLSWRFYFEELQKLSPYDFELLCKQVLKLIGAKDVILTKQTKDEGLDFYGRLSVVDLIASSSVFRFRPFESFLEIWLIGQAKHYRNTKVATPDLRELVGSVELASARAFSSSDPDKYPDLQIRVADPVFMLFFTTGEISVEGWRLIDRSGIVAMNGEMLATFLADHDVAITEEKGVKKFSREDFYNWLNSGRA